MTDLFSKFVFAKAIKNKSGAAVAEVVRDFIHLYGPPKKLLTDQGGEFCNEVSH